MQRRQFLGTVSASSFSIAPKWEIIAEESKCCTVITPQADGPISEVRLYHGMTSAASAMTALFKRHGIATFEQHPMTFVSSFESLAERGDAWNGVAADPEWHALREQANLQLVSLTIYQRLGSGDGYTGAA